jgi:hypothetical protein
MDADALKDQIIRPKLAEVFGDLLAGSIVTRATLAALQGQNEEERKRLIIEAVCAHERVLAMWGEARASKQKYEWLKQSEG